jgi:ABC-type multidrug transport system fused ATPase/permease subunit
MVVTVLLKKIGSQAPSLVKVFYRAFGKYKTRLSTLIFLGFLSSFVEAIGIAAVIPVFSFLTGAGQGTDPISRSIENVFLMFNIPFSFAYVLVLIIALFIVRAVILLTANYMRIKICAEYEEEVRDDLFKKTLQANWPFLLKQKLGHLETILKVNVGQGQGALHTISMIIGIATGLLMYSIVALTISPFVTVSTVVLGAFLFVVFWPLMEKTRKFSKDIELVYRNMAHHINENILGMKVVKAAQANVPVIARGKKHFMDMKDLRIKINFFRLIPISLMQPIGIIFIVAIFVVSYKYFAFNLAAFAAVIYLVQRIFVYIEQLQGQLHALNESAPFVEEMLSYSASVIHNREKTTGSSMLPFERDIKFSGVSFTYEGGRSETILDDVSFTIKRGNMVGIIGPSGSGKTTVVDLLLRLFVPTSGTITVDGEDVTSIDMSGWRNAIGYVSQDSFLLNDTIANNIRFYDESITEGEIRKASDMAELHDFIGSLPDGIDTVVGERGVMLSGGQRQRIVIARVLARKPQILIFDEATSSLDNETEKQIQKVIEGLRGTLTVIVIAHRLSTIKNADTLIALEKGKIVESGEPKMLLADKSSYFYKIQSLDSVHS